MSIFLTLVECCGEWGWGRPLVVSGAAPFLFLLLAGHASPALVCVASGSSVCVGGPGLGGAWGFRVFLLMPSQSLQTWFGGTTMALGRQIPRPVPIIQSGACLQQEQLFIGLHPSGIAGIVRSLRGSCAGLPRWVRKIRAP